MNDKEKILQYLDYKGISKNKFYGKTGLSIGFLDSGKSLGVDKLRIILDNYHDFNYNWLLTGEGEMLKTLSTATEGKKTNIIEINPEAKANTLIADVEASAGFGAILGNSKKLEELPAISLPNAPFGLNVAFRVQGDSMHPTIRHFDFVAANQLNEANAIRDGYTYVIIDKDDGVLCKRLYREGTDFKIVSDNPSYPPYKRSQDDILGFFKCFMRLSTDFRSYHDDIRNAIQDLRIKVDSLERKIIT